MVEKAIADGTIVGYGDDVNLVHPPDGPTHDGWWSAMSLAGVLDVLDRLKVGQRYFPRLVHCDEH